MARTFLDNVGGPAPIFPSYDWERQIPNMGLISSAFSAAHPGTQYTPTQPVAAPPIAPPTPSVAGQGPGHWQMPDYESLIRADPGYMAAQAIHNATVGADPASGPLARSRADSIRKALVDFGLIPQGWQSGYGDVDPATIAAAGQNPNSFFSQLQGSRSRGSADLLAALGARGMVSSGGLTGGEQLLQRNYDQALAGSTNNLLSALGGYEGSYASGVQGAENALIGAHGEAAGRVQQQYLPSWVVDPTTGQVTQAPAGGGQTPRAEIDALAPGQSWQNAQTYAGIGATPEPIVGPGLMGPITGPGLMGPITSDMVSPPSPLQTIGPPGRRRSSIPRGLQLAQ